MILSVAVTEAAAYRSFWSLEKAMLSKPGPVTSESIRRPPWATSRLTTWSPQATKRNPRALSNVNPCKSSWTFHPAITLWESHVDRHRLSRLFNVRVKQPALIVDSVAFSRSIQWDFQFQFKMARLRNIKDLDSFIGGGNPDRWCAGCDP